MRWLSAWFTLACVWMASAVCAGEQQQPARLWTTLKIESHPKGWGMALKSAKADGSIMGGHMSGGPKAPRIYQSEGKVTADDMAALDKLVAELVAAKVKPEEYQPDQQKEGYSLITISLADGTEMTFYSVNHKPFENRTIQTIREIVYRYNVGAW